MTRNSIFITLCNEHDARSLHRFFQYACGNWNRMHPLPENKSSIDVVGVMRDQLRVVLKDLLKDPINSRDNDATRKAKMFYNSCTNLSDIRKVGNEPIKEIIAQLGGWPVLSSNWTMPSISIETLLGSVTSNYSVAYIIDQTVSADDKDSSKNIIRISQASFGLPGRDYYLKMSSKKYIDAYHKYMTNIAILFGANATTAAKELLEVIEFETKLANVSLPPEDTRDRNMFYNKMTLRDLSTLAPQLKWLEYLRSIYGKKIDENENIVVYDLPYLKEIGKILAMTETRTIHNYVIWRLVKQLSSYLIDDYQKKELKFHQILYGAKSANDRWSQCVNWVNAGMEMAVGSLYIREHFDQDSKEDVVKMFHTLREAFNELLVENEWMDEETKNVAKEKANAIKAKIGYPQLVVNDQELCKKYQLMNTSQHGFLKNLLNIFRFKAQENLEKLRQPVDKKEWDLSPAIVNAAYDHNTNDIEIPAAILQPLIYSKISPKSLNYGGIGVVIGHEITHGFDDEGVRPLLVVQAFDGKGNVPVAAQTLVVQYPPATDCSRQAYRKWVSQHGEEMPLPGLNLTHDQLFFLNFAQTSCGSIRPESALSQVRSNPHSSGPIRVLGSLSNSHDFAKAYNCPVGSTMNPTEKCSVW